uniref:Uncharacterized protein n=1 Tax=Aegilops tauschii subsp. strangulata TaxID=200361 RepID=A0A453C835_AEGTS
SPQSLRGRWCEAISGGLVLQPPLWSKHKDLVKGKVGEAFLFPLFLSPFLLPQSPKSKGNHGGGEGRGAARRHLGRSGEGREEGVGWLEKRGERVSSLRLGEEKKDVEHASYG